MPPYPWWDNGRRPEGRPTADLNIGLSEIGRVFTFKKQVRCSHPNWQPQWRYLALEASTFLENFSSIKTTSAEIRASLNDTSRVPARKIQKIIRKNLRHWGFLSLPLRALLR
jgi:hypothetical protein